MKALQKRIAEKTNVFEGTPSYYYMGYRYCACAKEYAVQPNANNCRYPVHQLECTWRVLSVYLLQYRGVVISTRKRRCRR